MISPGEDAIVLILILLLILLLDFSVLAELRLFHQKSEEIDSYFEADASADRYVKLEIEPISDPYGARISRFRHHKIEVKVE